MDEARAHEALKRELDRLLAEADCGHGVCSKIFGKVPGDLLGYVCDDCGERFLFEVV